MTDKECYEIAVKYSGGEEGLVKLSEMIHLIGIDDTVRRISEQYLEHGVKVSDDFMDWMKGAFRYMTDQKSKN